MQGRLTTKCRQNQFSFFLKAGVLDMLQQFIYGYTYHVVQFIAIGRFHDDEISLREVIGRAQQYIPVPADVSTEGQPYLFIIFTQFQVNTGAEL